MSLGSPCRSHITQAFRPIIAGFPAQRGAQSHISLLVIMSFGDDARRYSGAQLWTHRQVGASRYDRPRYEIEQRLFPSWCSSSGG